MSGTQALRLLAELVEMDHSVRERRRPPTLIQKQRRAAICRELHIWALARQQGARGQEQRLHPRAPVKLRVQLLAGPRPLDLESDSLAVGGLSINVPFQPQAGDLLHLRLVPVAPDLPVDVRAEVIWYDPFRARAGVRFVEIGDEARELIERLVFADLVRIV